MGIAAYRLHFLAHFARAGQGWENPLGGQSMT